MPIGRTRKNKQQMESIPASSAVATTTISDEEGNTSECSQRHTSSSVYSTLESSTGNANFFAQENVISNQPTSSPDKYKHSHQNQNQPSNTEISN